MNLKTFKDAAEILVAKNKENKNKVMITISTYDHESGDFDVQIYANHMGLAVLSLLSKHLDNLFDGLLFGSDE